MSKAESCMKSNNGRPHDATTLAAILARLVQLEQSQNQVAILQERVAELETAQGRATQLEARIAWLEKKVIGLDKDLVDTQDQGVVPGTSFSPTLHAVRNGHTAVLERRLERGANPNQEDGHGGVCLIASACYGNPECTRLLIKTGGDVRYVYSGDNASILYMLALVFQDRPEDLYRPGDYVLTAILLKEAGAPVNEMQDDGRDNGRTALDLLYSMEVEEDTQHGLERRGLIAVLEGEVGHNPFAHLFHVSSADDAARLLLNGAANNSDNHVDITKVRSIGPSLRQSVLDLLRQRQGMREMLVSILLTMNNTEATSPFGILLGHESSILPVIAVFTGATGWSPRTMQEAIAALEESIEHFQTDASLQDGNDSDDVSDDGDY